MTGCGVLSIVYQRWVLGDFLCQGIGFLNNVALINSLWTVALGSVDRCFAIRVPFKHRYSPLSTLFVTLPLPSKDSF